MSADDPVEQLFARGVTDGLPVVPPTRERVEATIAASGLRAEDLIALVAPAFGRATVERIAVNAVMAGRGSRSRSSSTARAAKRPTFSPWSPEASQSSRVTGPQRSVTS